MAAVSDFGIWLQRKFGVDGTMSTRLWLPGTHEREECRSGLWRDLRRWVNMVHENTTIENIKALVGVIQSMHAQGFIDRVRAQRIVNWADRLYVVGQAYAQLTGSLSFKGHEIEWDDPTQKHWVVANPTGSGVNRPARPSRVSKAKGGVACKRSTKKP